MFKSPPQRGKNMTETANTVTVVATSIESRGGIGVVCVRIESPPWEPIRLEITVKDLNDATDALEQARFRVYQFAEALMDRTGDKGSLAFG
jgi:hypothetical protein